MPLSLLEQAFALGVGRSRQVLYEAPLDGRTPDAEAVSDDDILWLPVPPGSVAYGAAYSAEAAADLLVDGAMWQSMVDQQQRLLSTLDRWIERLERAHEDRAAAGLKAGEAVREQADQALLASIATPRKAPSRTRGPATTPYAVCALVARAGGITLAPPSRGGAVSDRIDPVERIAVTSRIRTRPVRLDGRWWREDAGPLVGHRAASGAPVALLWRGGRHGRRGRYEAVNPASGSRIRVTSDNAGDLGPRAVMFYRPLPERPLSPLRLLRFALRGTGADLRDLLLSGLVTVALGALVPIATGQVLGTWVPAAETGLIVAFSLAIIVTGIVAAAFALLQNLTVLRIEGRIEATLQPAVWDRLLRLPTAFFAERSTGELAGAAMGVSAIRRVLAGSARSPSRRSRSVP